jgi:hypothetical protein
VLVQAADSLVGEKAVHKHHNNSKHQEQHQHHHINGDTCCVHMHVSCHCETQHINIEADGCAKLYVAECCQQQ